MTRKKRERARSAAGGGRSAPPMRRAMPAEPRSWTGAIVVTVGVVVAVAALGWWRSRGTPPGRASGAPGSIVPVPLDSVAAAAQVFEAATSRGDWPEALRWQQRIAAALPTNPIALRQLGQTLHNHRNAVLLPDGRTRWLLRSSLARAEWEARALALFDSSAVVTGDPAHRALAHYWKGRTAQYEGLPIDALAEYEAALAIVPGDSSLRRVRDAARAELRE